MTCPSILLGSKRQPTDFPNLQLLRWISLSLVQGRQIMVEPKLFKLG